MRKCTRRGSCLDCPIRQECPRDVKANKKARRDKTDTASPTLVRKAATALEGGWMTRDELGDFLFADSVRVRTNRVLKRLRKLGLLLVRPGSRRGGEHVAEYRLTPDGCEVLTC